MLRRCGIPVDQLKEKLGSSVIVLATVQDGKVVLVAGVSADLVAQLKAGDIAGRWRRKSAARAAAERISRKRAARSPKIWAPRWRAWSLWYATGWLIERFIYSDGNKRVLHLVCLYSCILERSTEILRGDSKADIRLRTNA